MESNMEAHHISNFNNRLDPSLNPSNRNRYSIYPNQQPFGFRQNGSLPRKFNTNTNTNIPIRNAHYNYSHGKNYFE